MTQLNLVRSWNAITTTIVLSSLYALTDAFSLISTVSPIIRAPNSIPPASRKRPIHKTELSMTSSSDSNPQTGDIVKVKYSLTPNDDFVPTPLFDTGDDICFVLNKGNYLPAIHALLSEFKVGQSITGVSMDAGWGSKRSDLIATIPKEKSDGSGEDGMDYDAIKVGSELYLANGTKCRVVQVTNDDFTIDANPPLAGATYQASVTLLSMEQGPGPEKYLYSLRGVPDGTDGPYEIMTIALGCFWGGDLEYMRVQGVVGTAVGYTQGTPKSTPPTYEEVCSGTTGHTEAIQLVYDPRIVSYETLAKIGMERLGESRYLKNQTGNDRGTQYRHGIYYHNHELCESGVV